VDPMSKEERIELLSKVKMPPLFGKYDLSEVQVNDPGLVRYINLSPVILPHTEGRYTSRMFEKHKMSIVERLINNMMRTEKYTGKKVKTYKVVKEAFEIIEKRTKKNPVQVLVDALANAGPREEITRLQFGGISVQKSVDTSSARRLDIALRNICKGAVRATYKSKKPIAQCLAEEIILASKGDMNSWAVGKKEEIERVAASSR
jgi:small subunit ribosomal protein S7